MASQWSLCIEFPPGETHCFAVPALRPAGWPFENRLPVRVPDPYPWDGWIKTPGHDTWSRDLSALATIDSVVADINDAELQQSLQNAVNTARETIQRSLPAGFDINVESPNDAAEAY
jgi:hypothetical protein